MKIPQSNRRKALLLVDVQPIFINPENDHILPNIQKLLKVVLYDLYVESVFYAPKGSIWDKQLNWTTSEDTAHTHPTIKKLLADKNVVQSVKTSKSAFNGKLDLLKILKQQQIEEVHLVGVEILSHANLTSNSCLEQMKFKTLHSYAP